MAHIESLKSKPFVTLILSMSKNHVIATHDQEATAERFKSGLTNTEDQKFLREKVAENDAVLIGAKTLWVEKGAFRVASLKKNQQEPIWIVFRQNSEIPKMHPFFKQQGFEKWVFTCSSKPWSEREEFIGSSNVKMLEGSFENLWKFLHKKSLHKCALLGGAKFAKMFSNKGWIDEKAIHVMDVTIQEDERTIKFPL